MEFWAKVQVVKRKARSRIGRSYAFGYRRDNEESTNVKEFIVTIPGFVGELRGTMPEAELKRIMRVSHERVYNEVTNLSAKGSYGHGKFTKDLASSAGMDDVVLRNIARMIVKEE